MEKSLKLLMVEDSEDDARMILRELKRGGYDVDYHRVDNGPAMKAALKQSWDLVLSDSAMPQFDGLTALKTLREFDSDLPFILVSGTIGEETAVLAMKARANDYLMKGKLARLAPS